MQYVRTIVYNMCKQPKTVFESAFGTSRYTLPRVLAGAQLLRTTAAKLLANHAEALKLAAVDGF